MAINFIVASGNLVADAEVKDTSNGKMCKVRLANNQGYGDHERVVYYDLLFFGKRAEGNLPSILTKGAKVTASGQHQFALRKHEDKTYYDNVIRVDEIEVSQKASSGSFDPRSTPSNAKPLPQVSSAVNVVSDMDDDIPF